MPSLPLPSLEQESEEVSVPRRPSRPESTVSGRSSSTALLDRGTACAVIDEVLKAVRGSSSRALVVRSGPGIGKTSLLEYAASFAAGMRVLRLVGVESEMELPFAGLNAILGPVLDRIEELPAPQAEALGSAFGIVAASPNRFLVGLAALDLLSLESEKQPLLCLVDDAHWLDRESAIALSFVARRLDATEIAFIFAVQEPISTRGVALFEGLPELHLGGIRNEAARELIARAATGPLDEHVRERIVAEADGNPLALLEFASELTPAQLAGGSALPEPLPIGRQLDVRFLRRVRRLPADAQLLLLLLAAEPVGDGHLFWRAAGRLGIGPKAAGPAETDGLLNLTSRLGFVHPLVRSAVYNGATADERRRVHRALAADTDPDNADRRAWHRAAASLGHDEEVAAELERSAGRARERGGYAAAAALLERSVLLTPDLHVRAARMLEAAHAELEAGALGKASALLEDASQQLTDDLQHATAQRLRGAISLAVGDYGRTSNVLLEAAQAFEGVDVRVARDTHLAALEAAMYAGRLATTMSALEVARAARAAPRVRSSKMTVADLLLDGLALRVTDGYGAAVPPLRRAVEELRHETDLHWLGLGVQAAGELWEEEAVRELASRRVALARAAGALTALANALAQAGRCEIIAGRLDAAETCFEEAREVAAATGHSGLVGEAEAGDLLVKAWRGREGRTRRLAQASARDATARGAGRSLSLVNYALAVLELGLGNYQAALTAALEACEDENLWVATRARPDLIEATVRNGDPEAAEAPVARLAETTRPSGTEWALGMLARCRALVAAPNDAEELYQRAIQHLKHCRVIPELGRARLLYGEWLRRERRRLDAREELQSAYEIFVSMGAEAFAKRARAELLATGARARRRSVETLHQLTPQEMRVTELAAEGVSNGEIAAQLLISPRTVEYHLHKVFRKLGVSSRTQLARNMVRPG